ncbi:MAG: hybrid sensor histidine kinase/response regulator [Anaerolineae bacterium]|nr:hybrid sensor histidine kinase/response regulator [Anaerolineae bacterium]NUQ07112.1 hybrid sensor histidine kinase/response regulator [Anaerolineae bacterium]
MIPNPYAPGNYSILIVDDTPANLSVLSFMLQQEGFRVRPAISGGVALNAVQHELPDLVLLDIRMPEPDGYEVCRRLKGDPKTQNIPVIFISALDDVEDKVRAFEVGGVDYITKPFHVEEVVARVRAHLTLQDQRRAIEHLSNLKDDLMHIVAHDLKNPISIIRGYTELLLDGDSGLETDDGLRKIHVTADRMLALVTALLDYGQLERGLPLDLRSGTLAPLLAECADSFTLAARDKQIAIALRIDAPDAAALVDRERMAQAVCNLISNAVKYTPEGGQVEASLSADDRSVLIAIADDGPGIPPEHLPHLFQRFYRVPQTPGAARVTGTGLGLAIVKLIVEKHGGVVGVESAVGVGSRFTIRLPR